MSVEAELEESISYTPLQRMRHSAAHVMAEAVLEIFPDAKLAIGPAIEDGFFYDFDLPRALTPDDLPEIEQRMNRIIAGKYPFLQELERMASPIDHIWCIALFLGVPNDFSA